MSYVSDLVERFGRRTVVLIAAGLVAVVAVAVTVAVVVYDEVFAQDEYQITAQFSHTPGLYPDNAVDILGVPTGHIVSITPHASYVDVVMALPTNVKVPTNVRAVLMAPNPVSDRFVQLTPPWGSPQAAKTAMKDGGVIPDKDNRTIVPLELDDIYASVASLSKMLGPSGANKHGELSSVLHAFAGLVNGNGQDTHNAIEQIAAALPALTKHPDDLKNLVDGLDQLTHTLAAHDQTINSLYSDLATVTTQFADERATLGAAVANLRRGLAQVASFIRANQSHLSGSVKNLSTTVAAVMAEQKYLIKTFDTAPLGFQNFNRTIQPNGPCLSATGAPDTCTEIWGRVDTTSDVDTAIIKKYCGNSIAFPFLPILASNAGLAKKSATDTDCGALIGLLNGRTGPPGSPKTPDLDLTHYVGR